MDGEQSQGVGEIPRLQVRQDGCHRGPHPDSSIQPERVQGPSHHPVRQPGNPSCRSSSRRPNVHRRQEHGSIRCSPPSSATQEVSSRSEASQAPSAQSARRRNAASSASSACRGESGNPSSASSRGGPCGSTASQASSPSARRQGVARQSLWPQEGRSQRVAEEAPEQPA